MTEVSVKEKAKEKPIALNTVELMRVASSGLNMGPHHAMQIAEKLVVSSFDLSSMDIRQWWWHSGKVCAYRHGGPRFNYSRKLKFFSMK